MAFHTGVVDQNDTWILLVMFVSMKSSGDCYIPTQKSSRQYTEDDQRILPWMAPPRITEHIQYFQTDSAASEVVKYQHVAS